MNNYQINKELQSGKSAISLLKNPNVHDSRRHSFLSHICGSLFFEKLDFERRTKSLDVHIIALKGSPRIYDFFCRYNLNYAVRIFQAIDARTNNFNPKDYKETHGIEPIKGQEGHLGCTLSHFYLWKKLKESESDIFLVLEDDAFFTNYAKKALDYIVSNIPDDADLIYVNGRASEKLYAGCKFKDGFYSNTPNKMFFTRKEMLKLMEENFDLLRRESNGKAVLYNGADGYILTKSGVNKLNDYVEKFGMSGKPGGIGNNIDLILTSISTDISDHQKKDMAYNVKECIKNGSIREKAIIKSYICSFPIIDGSDRGGIGTGTEINKKVNKITFEDIDLIRDSAIKLEAVNKRYAFDLMNLASKLRPEGKFISSEKERMKKNLNSDRPKSQP